MKRSYVSAAAAFLSAIVFAGNPASAVTLSKANPGDWFDGGGKATVSGISNRSGNFSAGGFRLTDGEKDFVAWCLDVLGNLTMGTFTITDNPFTGALLGDVRKSNIERLFEVNYSTLDISNSGGSNGGNLQSAGFQLALWELVYEDESGPFDVYTGTWYAASPTAALDWANTFLGKLGEAITQNYDLTFYEYSSANGQDLVSVTPVPLPPAVLLFGLGLTVLYGSGRRKKS